jgi:murein DD-endopeptidase MepM/ murein hydrolase activator NlpD
LDTKTESDNSYTIKIIPSGEGKIKSVKLPLNLIKYGLGSLAVLGLLFVGVMSFAVYATFTAKSGSAEINDLRSVNSIQQEQLLQLSRKANALQDEMQELTSLESDLRRQSGMAPASDEGSGGDGTHDGQGGPYVDPDVANVREALSQVERKIAVRKESFQSLQKELKERQAAMGTVVAGFTIQSITIPSIWPCKGDVSSPYGLRWGGSDFHPGIDIANDMGTPIVATADGVVEVAGWNSGGYGNMVDIDHGNGLMTRYGHASQVVVTAGQHVKRGQIIAYMGSTGFSTGPHCHYEVHVNGQVVNPATYL